MEKTSGEAVSVPMGHEYPAVWIPRTRHTRGTTLT